MSKLENSMEMIEAAFSRFGYPEDFLNEYDQMECLSGHRGRETFLVQRKKDGRQAVAKCYDRSLYDLSREEDPLKDLEHPGLPRYLERYENERFVVILREYVEGTPLSDLVREREMQQAEILDICRQLCDILDYLHSRPTPVIHRDVKPENVILQEDGKAVLIDFDIARTYKQESDSDTLVLGTKAYAPPEQYGFAQTDARTDVYSLGVLLRFLLTGSTRKNRNIHLDPALEKIIAKATAFSPADRYPDMKAMKRALQGTAPNARKLRRAGIILGIALLCAAFFFAGVKTYQYMNYSPFTEGSVPAYQSDPEMIAEAAAYMKEEYGTDLFDDTEELATVGLIRTVLIDLYGFDRDYVYGINTDMPQESPDYFLPWGYDDGQLFDRDPMVYVAVKVHDPSIVEDWSSLKDDNGEYPGERVAMAYAEKHGILEGVNRPDDITVGDVALILYNAEKSFGK